MQNSQATKVRIERFERLALNLDAGEYCGILMALWSEVQSRPSQIGQENLRHLAPHGWNRPNLAHGVGRTAYVPRFGHTEIVHIWPSLPHWF